ncbi:hypothetical protein SFBM_0265 [Candidatus Arthromitus sp. SFB-mouse-Japan]|uniref:DNA recombination protein RmuC n=1 Tax=unclassified Candidatus Neoarthromitus TaxID=2638829 RepID=UPI00021B7D29|nr:MULTISPECIES: DNA recombination protein RmuC [unclassified Candidatus Arthromitus]EIA21868.1 hypothetical protein SFB1_338G10 [Candidatus Arthromitus sp. SFB-1]EIA22222.1 hypothetical protein SFB2_264G1 [Candidatus Arthromitus sp. SFB-2]EIA27053.1 RmuC family protein [Candidatus Arthromitus sp. SFB-co]EIA29840.1 hypothetical protein SFB4_042G5 [Candidatus Arthromitus sp. SFB-4]EIA31233.1 RmuC family protein [Candidatus Arthromitus sp. SFB-mouse-SU]
MINTIIIIFLLIIVLLNIFLILCLREYIGKFQTNNYLNHIINTEHSLNNINTKLNNALTSYEKNLRDEIRTQIISIIDLITNRLNDTNINLNTSLDSLKKQTLLESKMNRDELSKSFEKISISLEKQLKNITNTQNNLISSTEKKLDIIRNTVDEKLQQTFDNRLSKSFEIVSNRLEVLYKGIGEINTLFISINDLRKILSNVKTRGIIGEYQLENLLSQTLNENQYIKNVITKNNSKDRVEFALKIPSKNSNKELLLPIDSKFPLDNYSKLVESYESSDKDNIEKYSKLLETSIKKFSKDINEKYIDLNNTTDFAILFLPIESLYSEISKRVNLIEFIQREYKIIITGPTTLYALLNSLNLAFKTISIEKHSSKVWKVLGEVKKEFESFSTILEKAKNKLEQVSNDLISLSDNKTKKIQNKLKDIESISYTE